MTQRWGICSQAWALELKNLCQSQARPHICNPSVGRQKKDWFLESQCRQYSDLPAQQDSLSLKITTEEDNKHQPPDSTYPSMGKHISLTLKQTQTHVHTHTQYNTTHAHMHPNPLKMGKEFEHPCNQSRCTDSKETHGKMLDSTG